MSVVLTHEPWERLFAGPTISWASHISSSSHEYHRTRYLVTGWPFCMTDCRAIVLIGIFPSYHEMFTRSAMLLRIDRDALTWTPNSPSAREDPWKRYKTSDESCEVYDNLSESEAMKSRSSLVSEGTVEDFSEGTEQVSVPSDSQFKRTFSGLVMMADKTVILKELAGVSMLKGWLELMGLCKALCSPVSGKNIFQGSWIMRMGISSKDFVSVASLSSSISSSQQAGVLSYRMWSEESSLVFWPSSSSPYSTPWLGWVMLRFSCYWAGVCCVACHLHICP